MCNRLMASHPDDFGLHAVRVLGPIDLVTDAGVVIPTGRIGRKLLGALAISVNHAVSADRLAEIIWHESPPASRDNTMQTYVFRLREEVGHDRIVSEDHSYCLQLAPGQLDALEFERLASLAAKVRQKPSECIRLCQDALSLWRGVPFGEFVDEDPFRLEAIRLDELRLFVMEMKLESDLALGKEELVVGTLEAIVDDHPYRERMWHLLIRALSCGGRRVEALRACDRLRDILAEVGLEPSCEIRNLEEQIITEDGGMTLTFD
jgi:DNA-binding SARP family transcriptional activator